MDPFGLITSKPKAAGSSAGRGESVPLAASQNAKPLDHGNLFQQVLGTSDYMKEWRKKHREVVEEYKQEKRRLSESWHHEEKKLHKQLEHREEQINRWQGVGYYKPDDPRKQKAEKLASEKYQRYERQAKHDFERQKREALRDLQKQRDNRSRGIRRELMGR